MESLYPHLFAEVKSLVNKNFNDILDQLHDTILETVDAGGGSFSVYIIAMKGAKIAFYEFHSYASLLDEYDIPNYRGFVPLGYIIEARQYFEINHDATLVDYLRHISKVGIPHMANDLKQLGVESIPKIEHPHIWNLLNQNQSDYVHKLFQHMAENESGKDIK